MANNKYWWAVVYPDNFIDNWEDEIAGLVQLPVAYCLHDNDICSDTKQRDPHYHIIIAFNNTTTYNHALNVFRSFAPGVHTCKPIINIRYAYDYLIHDTDDSKKKGKYLYPVSSRILVNNFDIGKFEQRSLDDKYQDCIELKRYIISHNIETLIDLDIALDSDPDIDDAMRYNYELVQVHHASYISNCFKSVFFYNQRKRLEEDTK